MEYNELVTTHETTQTCDEDRNVWSLEAAPDERRVRLKVVRSSVHADFARVFVDGNHNDVD